MTTDIMQEIVALDYSRNARNAHAVSSVCMYNYNNLLLSITGDS